MHIDTLFTQVKRNTWVLLRNVPDTEITQFHRHDITHPVQFASLEALLSDISKTDWYCDGEACFIYSGNDCFPFDAREQWTDSCNLLALQEGVVLGYDRNDKTIEAFKQNGFQVISGEKLLQQLDNNELHPEALPDTFISMPSAELSRARGGFHCMSMPLLRDDIQ